jgi:hypothetical protein
VKWADGWQFAGRLRNRGDTDEPVGVGQRYCSVFEAEEETRSLALNWTALNCCSCAIPTKESSESDVMHIAAIFL